MKEKKLIGFVLIAMLLFVFSWSGIDTWSRKGDLTFLKTIDQNPLINSNLFFNKKIPGIVEGSARMVNTEAFFKYETPSISSTQIHLLVEISPI